MSWSEVLTLVRRGDERADRVLRLEKSVRWDLQGRAVSRLVFDVSCTV